MLNKNGYRHVVGAALLQDDQCAEWRHVVVSVSVDKVSEWGWAKVYIDGWKRGQGYLDGTYDRHVVCVPNKGMLVYKEQVTAPRCLSTIWQAVFIPHIHKLQENRIG